MEPFISTPIETELQKSKLSSFQSIYHIEKRSRIKKWMSWTLIILLVISAFVYSLSRKVFDDPTCTTIFARNGELLGARIASDGQWRFPPCDSIPEKYEKCLLIFEDKYFFRHPGLRMFGHTG